MNAPQSATVASRVTRRLLPLRATRFSALFAAALAACAALALPARAQESGDASARLDADIQKAKADVAQAKKDAAKADADLRKTDSLLSDEAARASQSQDRAAKDRDRREKENAGLQARVQDTQNKINAERAGMGRQQNGEDEIKARQKRLTALMAAYCDSLAARIQSAVPWDQEARIDRVKALKKDLESGSATPDEGFARLGAILKEEIKGGDEIALISKPVTRKNGDVVNAQVLKVGNQWLVYMDEEGKRFGVMERKAAPGGGWAWDWREDPGFAEKNRIKAAIEVKSAKRPPQLAVLDLGITPGLGNAPVTPASAATPAAPTKASSVKGGK